MDIPLHYFDEYVGDTLYSYLDNPFAKFASPLAANATKVLDLSSTRAAVSSVTQLLATVPGLSSLPRDSIVRQSISLYGLTYLGILVLYFSVATFSYYFIFDHRMKLHPRYLPDQVRKEINYSLEAFPVLDLLTLPWFVGDVRGWSMLYDTIAEGPFGERGGALPWVYMAFSAVFFLWFTDFCIYWVHRWLHIPFLYKRLHKPHHKWIIPTPYASHAFHPVDGYLQSVPYHIACYLFPIHKYMFIGLFSFVNLWSIFIHDSDMLCDHPLEHYVNGPAHHTLHHIYFTCNYGQYFVWADKYFGSFRVPAKGDDPLIAVLAAIEEKKVLDAVDVAASASTRLSPAPSASDSDRSSRDTSMGAVIKAPDLKRIDSGLGSETELGLPGSRASSKASSFKGGDEPAPVVEIQEVKTRPRREGLRARK